MPTNAFAAGPAGGAYSASPDLLAGNVLCASGRVVFTEPVPVMF